MTLVITLNFSGHWFKLKRVRGIPFVMRMRRDPFEEWLTSPASHLYSVASKQKSSTSPRPKHLGYFSDLYPKIFVPRWRIRIQKLRKILEFKSTKEKSPQMTGVTIPAKHIELSPTPLHRRSSSFEDFTI